MQLIYYIGIDLCSMSQDGKKGTINRLQIKDKGKNLMKV